MNRKFIEDGYPIVKLKKISFSSYKEFPKDFNPNVYKKIHIDLNHMSDYDAFQHFKMYGFKEGRPYKRNQKPIISDYISKILPF